jgi:uncharacterized protein (TIGR02145 family)
LVIAAGRLSLARFQWSAARASARQRLKAHLAAGDAGPRRFGMPKRNTYQAMKIWNQIWTVENLRVTKFNDGSPITKSSSGSSSDTIPAYCFYSNTTNADSIKKYGALYNWYAVKPSNPKSIAPAGWHIPADSEWTVMANYLIANRYNWDSTEAGNKIAKSLAAKTDWYVSTKAGCIGNDLSKNNSSGFSVLPGGLLFNSQFVNKGYHADWWTATGAGELYAMVRELRYGYEASDSLDGYICSKSWGGSVRLVRD